MSPPPMMQPRLKKHEASAGMPKTLRALSMPMTSAERLTMRMNGYMIRVSSTMRLRSLGPKDLSAKESSRSTIHGATSTPRMVMRLMITTASERTLFASCQADFSPSSLSRLLKVVTKDCDRAPSAKRSRSKLGILKARLKQSAKALVPKSRYMNISRASPKIRLSITALPMMPVALAVLRFSAAVLVFSSAMEVCAADQRRHFSSKPPRTRAI